MRAPPNAPFSHIQVVPKVSPVPSVLQETSPQPTFRKPSLSYEADAAMADSTKVSMLISTDSLANRTVGTTFAARARAAELQAARARKQLKDKDPNQEENTASAHEVMTFTKTRSKGSKAWKPLNLNDLPESLDDGLVDLSRPQSSSSVTSSARSKQRLSLRLAHSTQSFPMLSKLTAIEQLTDGSLDPRTLGRSVAGYDAGQWDPELPLGDSSLANLSITNVSPPSRVRSSSTVALFPIPILSSDAEDVQKESEYLQQKQTALIAELTHHLGVDIKSAHGSIDGTEPSHAISMDTELPPSLQYGEGLRTGTLNGEIETDEDPFADSPISIPLAPHTPTCHNTFPGQLRYGMSVAGYGRYHYPAVKGTMSQNVPVNFPYPHYQDYLDECKNKQPALHALTNLPPSTYRKLSSDEKKGMLLEQLHAVADNALTSGGVTASGRTVLHDPLACDELQTKAVKQPSGVAVKTKADLIISSDPLPWKERLVDVVPASSLPDVDYTRVGSDRTTAPYSFPASRHFYSDISVIQYTRQDDDDTEAWWHTDNRLQPLAPFSSSGKMSHARSIDTSHMSGSNRGPRAPFDDAWSEDSQSTFMPEINGAADLAEGLLVPVLANLKTYLSPGGAFNKHGRVPEWCVDQGVGGNDSFFGEDWGAPPPRVGRDPRYQPVHHEGKFTVFENFGGRWANEGYLRRKMW